MNAPVGVAVLGHGTTASRLLDAARGIAPGGLEDVVAIDAGPGQTPSLEGDLCRTIEELDRGRGVVVLVDLLGSSPCQCAQREGAGHQLVVLSGLNLAMLLKLAVLDRKSIEAQAVADACADSGQRSVTVRAFGRSSDG